MAKMAPLHKPAHSHDIRRIFCLTHKWPQLRAHIWSPPLHDGTHVHNCKFSPDLDPAPTSNTHPLMSKGEGHVSNRKPPTSPKILSCSLLRFLSWYSPWQEDQKTISRQNHCSRNLAMLDNTYQIQPHIQSQSTCTKMWYWKAERCSCEGHW